jgi:hypothetical protein
MSDSHWLLSVAAKVEPDDESAFNQWYDHEHLPVILACPGIHSASRFVTDGPEGRRYLTQYVIDGPESIQTPEFAKAGADTPFKGRATFEIGVYRPVEHAAHA